MFGNCLKYLIFKLESESENRSVGWYFSLLGKLLRVNLISSYRLLFKYISREFNLKKDKLKGFQDSGRPHGYPGALICEQEVRTVYLDNQLFEYFPSRLTTTICSGGYLGGLSKDVIISNSI